MMDDQLMLLRHFVAARVTLSVDAIGAAEINQAVPVETSESIPPLEGVL